MEERYADLINGIGFQGQQIIQKEDLQELDTQTGIWQMPLEKRKQKRSIRNRDIVRKTAKILPKENICMDLQRKVNCIR